MGYFWFDGKAAIRMIQSIRLQYVCWSEFRYECVRFMDARVDEVHEPWQIKFRLSHFVELQSIDIDLYILNPINTETRHNELHLMLSMMDLDRGSVLHRSTYQFNCFNICGRNQYCVDCWVDRRKHCQLNNKIATFVRTTTKTKIEFEIVNELLTHSRSICNDMLRHKRIKIINDNRLIGEARRSSNIYYGEKLNRWSQTLRAVRVPARCYRSSNV